MRRIAIVVVAAFSAATTLETQSVTVAAGTTFAGPTFVGNSFASAGHGLENAVQELAVSPDGWLMQGAAWAEDQHPSRLFDPSTGALLGPPNGSNHNGIYGVAADNTYVYYATGDGWLLRGAQSFWRDPANVDAYDPGTLGGGATLKVDSGGNQLMGMTECGGQLFVTDSNGPIGTSGQVSPNTSSIKAIPISLSGVTTSWVVARARTLACDRQGNIWVLQQSVSGGASADVERFTPTGTLLTSFAVPTDTGGIAADPSSDRILVADNGQDQNFKWFNYAGTQTGQLGVTGGYLQGSDPGRIGALRFVGPRAAAINADGSIYTAESCNPGVGQVAWNDTGPSEIITKYNANGTIAWQDHGIIWAGTGQPSSDGTKFYSGDFEFTRDGSGKYQPTAFTVDPWANPTDPRKINDYSEAVYEREMDGHVYEFMNLPNNIVPGQPGLVFEQQPNSEIMKLVVKFDDNTTITTNGTVANVSSNPALVSNTGVSDFWMTDTGDMWTTAGTQVWRYRVQGFAGDGTPQYTFAAVDPYPKPAALSQGVQRIEIIGTTAYLFGFSGSDPNPGGDWGGWLSSGRHLVKYNSLPTGGGWPAPAWEHDFSYGSGSSGTGSTSPATTGFPTGFAADGAYVGVAWLHDPNTNQGEILTLNDSDGTLAHTYSTPVPAYGRVGLLDMMQSITAGNGWIWAEDDWAAKVYGICPSGSCT
jgi:hypothetical protein